MFITSKEVQPMFKILEVKESDLSKMSLEELEDRRDKKVRELSRIKHQIATILRSNLKEPLLYLKVGGFLMFAHFFIDICFSFVV